MLYRTRALNGFTLLKNIIVGKGIDGLIDWVRTIPSSLTGFAMAAHPHIIKLRHDTFDDCGVVGKDAGLKVTLVGGFHADASPRKVRTANIHFLAVEHHHLKMHTRA